MKKRIGILLTCVFLATGFAAASADQVKASDYILVSQAQSLLNTSRDELDHAKYKRDEAQDRLDDLKDSGASDDDIRHARDERDYWDDQVDKKQDKVDAAGRILDFVNTRTNDEVFLAGMQEKFQNEATLYPMQQKIQGSKDVANGDLSQAQLLQQAIASQSALGLADQVADLTNQYNAKMAEYQSDLNAVAALQKQYDDFAATLDLPTDSDKIRLAQIRNDFHDVCIKYDSLLNN